MFERAVWELSKRLKAHRQLIGCVLASIIEYCDLLNVVPHVRSDAFQNLGQRSQGVIGDDQNADAFALALRQIRIVLERSRGFDHRQRVVGQPRRARTASARPAPSGRSEGASPI